MTEPTDAITADEIATLESQERRAKDPEFLADLRQRSDRINRVYDLSVPVEELDERGRQVRATLESQKLWSADPEFMADLRRRAARLDASHNNKQRVELRLPADVVAAAKLAAHHRFLSLNAWAEEAFAEKLATVVGAESPADATFVQEIKTILAENAKIVQLLADQ